MLFHCTSGCTNAPQCHVIRRVSVLFLSFLFQLLPIIGFVAVVKCFNILIELFLKFTDYHEWVGTFQIVVFKALTPRVLVTGLMPVC